MLQRPSARPSAIRGLLAALALGASCALVSCGTQSSSGTSSTKASSKQSEPSQTEKALAAADPFANVAPPEKKLPEIAVPTTPVGQRGVLDDPTWHECVAKAHEAYITFNNAEKMRQSQDEGYREEVQKGKRLLEAALDDSWGIEDELSRQPGKSRTYQTLMKVRILWNDKLRAVGKLVRG
ncbi:MAG: hypothetical protein R3F34_17930 [Planctomycetota bacterium]